MSTCPPQEALQFVNEDMPQGQALALGMGTVGVFSSRSPGKQTPNEDAAGVFPCGEEGLVLAVADGVGGMAAGEQASRIAITTLGETLAGATSSETIRMAILGAFDLANERVRNLGLGAATTLAIVEVQGSTIRTYHAGDSEIVIVGQRGKLKLQTLSHSPVAYAVEAGVLDAADAIHHEDRHLVSNVIGLSEMRIELGPTMSLARRDTLIVGSDGLFDNLTTAEISEGIRKGEMQKVVTSLAMKAKDRMANAQAGQPSKPDDMTFLIYRRRT